MNDTFTQSIASGPYVLTDDAYGNSDLFAVLDAASRQHRYAVLASFGAKVFLRYDDCVTVLRDPRFREPGLDLLTFQGITDGPLYDWWRLIMFNNDGEVHTRLRRLVSRAFTPAAMEAMRPVIRRIAEELVDAFGDDDPVELIGRFADPLPVRVICELLRVPGRDHERFAHWSRDLGLAFVPPYPAGVRERLERAITGLYGYVGELLARRRAEPGDDLVTALIRAEEDGDRLSGEELPAMVANLLLASHDTTTSALGCAVVTLLDRFDERRRLVEEPASRRPIIEEVLRFNPPVGGGMRVTTEPVDLGGGLVIAAGEFVIAEGLAANRDLAHFPNPDRFDPRRFAAERDAAMSPPLTFGLGAHYCLGANLARAELIEALPVLFGRLPGLRLAADHIDWRDKGFRAPVALPVWR